MGLCFRCLTTLEVVMNAFLKHHQDNIRFHYRCLDRILLHATIQPFQQEQRAVGFFDFYRQIYPVTRQLLREIASQYHNWAKNRSQKWGVPIQEDPPGRRDHFDFVHLGTLRVSSLAHEPVADPSWGVALLRWPRRNGATHSGNS